MLAKDGHADLERLQLAAFVVHHVQGEKAFALRQVDPGTRAESFDHGFQLLGGFIAFQAYQLAVTTIGVHQRNIVLGAILGEAMQTIGDDEADRRPLLLEDDFMTVEVSKIIRDPIVAERLPVLDGIHVK